VTAAEVSSEAQVAAYHEILAYTVTRGDAEFIHQYAVDAWAAQTAHSGSKPIGVFFALMGLYLHVEHGFTGRAIQRAHMRLAQHPEPWPVGPLPSDRGTLSACEVLSYPEGDARDAMIRAWVAAVWAAYAGQRDTIAALLRRRGLIA
jgi:hypothetical protein